MINQVKTIGTKSMALLTAVVLLSGSPLIAQKKKLNKSQKGAIVGASGGAVIGGMIGKAKGNTALALFWGPQSAVLAEPLSVTGWTGGPRKSKSSCPDAQVERVGEGIKVSMGSDILFDVDSYALKPATKQQLINFFADAQ